MLFFITITLLSSSKLVYAACGDDHADYDFSHLGHWSNTPISTTQQPSHANCAALCTVTPECVGWDRRNDGLNQCRIYASLGQQAVSPNYDAYMHCTRPVSLEWMEEVYFDGSSSDQCISDPSGLGDLPLSGAYTIEAWINVTDPANNPNGGIVGWGQYGSTRKTNAFRLQSNNGRANGLRNYWWNDDIGFNENDDPEDFDMRYEWHHVASTYDGNTYRALWVDGEVKSEITNEQEGNDIDESPLNFCIGVTNSNERFEGWIKNVKIYKYFTVDYSHMAPTPTTTGDPDDDAANAVEDSEEKGGNAGAAVGIAIAVIVVLCLCGGGFYYKFVYLYDQEKASRDGGRPLPPVPAKKGNVQNRWPHNNV